jgi:hypothetical protein
MVLKGAPLAFSVYPSPALRPMADIDVLVEPHRAADATAVLAGSGWIPSRAVEPDVLASLHGVGWRKRPGALDLHWYLLHESCWPGADAALWRRARPIVIAGYTTLAPSPADQLLHTCVRDGSRGPRCACRCSATSRPRLEWRPSGSSSVLAHGIWPRECWCRGAVRAARRAGKSSPRWPARTMSDWSQGIIPSSPQAAADRAEVTRLGFRQPDSAGMSWSTAGWQCIQIPIRILRSPPLVWELDRMSQ